MEPLPGGEEERRRACLQAGLAGTSREVPGAERALPLPQLQQPWRPLPGEGTRQPLSHYHSDQGGACWDTFDSLPPQPRAELLPPDARAAWLEQRAPAPSFPSNKALRACLQSPTAASLSQTQHTPRAAGLAAPGSPLSQRSGSSGSLGAVAAAARIRRDQLPPLPGGGEAGSEAQIDARAERDQPMRGACGSPGFRRRCRSSPCHADAVMGPRKRPTRWAKS